MMNRPQKPESTTRGALIIAIVSIIAGTLVILGFDGIAAVFDVVADVVRNVWDGIKGVYVKIWNWIF